MPKNAVVTNSAFQLLVSEVFVRVFVICNRHRAVEIPDGQRNMNSDEDEKKDVALFHVSRFKQLQHQNEVQVHSYFTQKAEVNPRRSPPCDENTGIRGAIPRILRSMMAFSSLKLHCSRNVKPKKSLV